MIQYKRSDVYEELFMLNGEPLTYDYFPFWRDIINSDRLTTEVPQLNRQMLWRFSRQVAKSTNLGILGVGLSLEHKNVNVVITQPTDEQISKFSVQNIKPLEKSSVVVDMIYKKRGETQNQVKNKSYVNGSRIILANIYSSVLSARGTPGAITFIDEYQDTPPKNANIVIQGMRRSPVRISIRCGTPLEEENDLQILFNESTGTEWAVKCTGCGKYNIDLGLKNVGKKGVMCMHCGKRLDPRNGMWVDARPGAPIEGYHINELAVPRDAPGATEWSLLLYEIDHLDERTIQNEILGNSFSDNIHPITRQTIMSLCDPKREYVTDISEIEPWMKRVAFAGLDWAMEVSERKGQKELKSYTMLSISSYNLGSGKLEVVFVKRYYERMYDNPTEVVNDIVYWLNAFNVRVCGMDYGVGHKENQRIAEQIGYDRVMEIEYVGELSEGMTWHMSANKFCVGRTKVYDDTLEDFLKKGLFRFAKYEGETSDYEKDLTTLYRFSDAHNRKTRFGKSAADDWWQNLVYTRLAMLMWRGDLQYATVD